MIRGYWRRDTPAGRFSRRSRAARIHRMSYIPKTVSNHISHLIRVNLFHVRSAIIVTGFSLCLETRVRRVIVGAFGTIVAVPSRT